MDFSYARYLASKRSVDDRALNRNVLARLQAELVTLGASPLRVLELGGGLGTMLARLLEWQVLGHAEYMLVDADRELLARGAEWLAAWAKPTGHRVTAGGDAIRIERGREIDVRVRLVPAELEDFLQAPGAGAGADLLLANAFLDLVDVPSALSRLFDLAAPNGLYWFTINFDGLTIFEPEHPLDAGMMAVYHRSMDERMRNGRPAGDSKSGRHLFGHLPGAGASILAAGGSDWAVYPAGGGYEADEAYFLHHIIHTVDEELNWRSGELDTAAVRAWVALRHAQIDRGELAYVAHQLDFTGHCRATPAATRAERPRATTGQTTR